MKLLLTLCTGSARLTREAASARTNDRWVLGEIKGASQLLRLDTYIDEMDRDDFVESVTAAHFASRNYVAYSVLRQEAGSRVNLALTVHNVRHKIA